MGFPSNIPSYQGFNSGDTLAADNHAAQHNQEQADIAAIATKVGTGVAVPSANTVLRGSGSGTTTFDKVHLASDVSGTLPISSGGTGTNAATGSGEIVLQTGPTISSPVLTSPTSSNGTFNNPTVTTPTETGGTYNTATLNQPTINYATNSIPAGILESGSVNYADLLSSIFSGQVSSISNTGTAGGTMWYINLCGLKMWWGQVAAQTSSAGGNTYTITLPSGFFSTVQSVNMTPNLQTINGGQTVSADSISTPSILYKQVDPSGTGTLSPSFLIIGA